MGSRVARVRRVIAGLVSWLLAAGVVVVPPVPAAALAAPSAVDDDVSVAGRDVPVEAREPNPAEDETQVTSAATAVPVWPGAASALVDVPVPAGRLAPADVAPSRMVAGVSALADGAAAAALPPVSREPSRAGPGRVSPAVPTELGGLAAGGLAQVRVFGRSRATAESLGVAQVFTLERADGVSEPAAVDVRVDYSRYAEAFGGSFADRLRLVGLPGCALTAPELPACAAAPVPLLAVNNPSEMTLTARLPVAGDNTAQRRLMAQLGEATPPPETVFAVTSSGEGGSTGDYTATDLNPGGTWQVGLSSGSFTYEYPIPEPPLLTGEGLGLSLSYDSQSVDAFTQSTNHQSGWVGLGWSMSPGYIERRFRPCSEDIGDGSPKERTDQQYWGDLCWESPDQNDGESDTNDFSTSELYLNLNGVSTRIVKDRVSGQWKTEQDLGWKLELIAGGAGKDYWKITTREGDQYRFGYTDGSNWWVPAIGDDPGEPYYENYPVSYSQTWRWNLDRVHDVRENQIILSWVEETNYYQRWLGGSILSYDRGGYLKTIEYGYNGQVAGSQAVGKVEVTSVSRCVEATTEDDPVANGTPACPPVSKANAASYPDVPVDLMCSSSSCGRYVPTFFSTKRLDRVTSYYWNPDADGWRNIYRLQLRFKTVNPPGLTGKLLWLDRIFPEGLIGSDADKLRLPGLNFDAVYLPGRVDHAEAEHGVSETVLPRIDGVDNGFGGRTNVTYGHVAPCPTSGSATGNDEYWDWYNSKADSWDVNTDECAPVWHKPEGSPAGWGQFHKYLALKVVEDDRVGGSPSVVTEYEYRGEAAWALGYGFMDSQGLTESWNEWRGYPTVRVHTGSGTDPGGYSMSEHTFFRGLYYDYYADWQTFKKVKITDYDGATYSDMPGQAGKPLQVRHYQLTGYASDPAQRAYAEVASSRFKYRWVSSGDGPGYRNPYFTDQYYQRNRVRLDEGTWREDSEYVRTFDEYGLPSEIVDYNQVGVTGDDTCTSITYAHGVSQYLRDYPETVETWGGSSTCGGGELLARTVTFYDGRTAVGQNDIYDGNPTMVRTYTTGTGYVTTKASYDSYGRATSNTDELGKVTAIGYSPAANWPGAGVTTTNPAGHASTIAFSSSHGQANWVIDANGKRTDINYDQLGRPIAVYLPGDPEGAGIASLNFDYRYTWNGTTGQPTAATRVGSHALVSKAGGGEYLASYGFDDGLGRLRETQTPSPAGGRTVAATHYDPRGLAAVVSAPFHNTDAPGAGLVNASTSSLPSWTSTRYDTLARETVTAAMAGSSELWRTTTTYHGDHTTTTPPEGAAPVTVWADVRGNTTLRQEHVDGGTVDLSYQWDLSNQLVGLTDDAGNHWSYGYDLAGRRTQSVDPDAGTISYGYDAAGRPTSTTDARGVQVSTSYDVLGRPTARWDGPAGTGVLLAEWVYDSLAKGELTSATRWHEGAAYTATVAGYTDRYQPTGTTISIPAAEGALAGSYPFSYGYTDAGWPSSVTLPAAGGMPAETITTSYTALGLPDRLTSDFGGGSSYIDATSYDKTGDLIQLLLGAPGAGAQVARDLSWEEATGRLVGIATTTGADAASPATVQDDDYGYDPAGNLLSITDQVAGQAQCFGYDQLRRLVEAWTVTTAACTEGPSAAAVGGPDPYWHSWSHDSVGNRLTQVEHGLGGAGDITTSYSYPAPGGPQPHTLAEQSLTDDSGTVVTGYGYDPAGNTTSRPGEHGQQSLTWDPEGHLATLTDESGTSSYVYDPDGNRIITRNGDGSAVLYLPHSMEIHASASGVTSCTRYYGGVAVRTASGLSWLAADNHHTGTLAIDADTLALTQRRTDPYGNPRGAVTGGSWPDDKTFLGAVGDPSGLVHLGAREYDPATGRFISVDPVIDPADPQQLHGYAYANSNPVTWSDPSGLVRADIEGAKTKSTPKGSKSSRKHKETRLRRNVLTEDRGTGKAKINNVTIPKNLVARPVDLLIEVAFVIDQLPGAENRFDSPEEMAYYTLWAIVWACTESNQRLNCGAGLYELQNLLTSLQTSRARSSGGGRWLDDVPPEILEAALAAGWGTDAGASRAALRGGGGRPTRPACRNSFTPDTLVLMADGSHKAIQDIRIGDMVLATDPDTGLTRPQPVTATITGHGEKQLIDITITTDEDPAGHTIGPSTPAAAQADTTATATITATGNHPFWVTNTTTWTNADDLQPGDQLHTRSGEAATVTHLDTELATVAVHNLTIAQTHTYHVLAGGTPILVHNACDELGHSGRHQFPSAGAGRSQFFDNMNLNRLADTRGVHGVLQRNGNMRYVMRGSGNVGIDRTTGLPTNVYTVVRRPNGSVLTMFPGTSPMS